MNIFYDSLIFLAFLSLTLCILAWILKTPLRSFIMQVSEFWRKAGWLTRAGALTVFFALWIYASVKPTNQTQSASTPLSQQIELIMSGTASLQSGIELVPPESVTSNTVPELTAAQAAAGFCILSVETNQNTVVCWSTNDLPANSTVHVQENWSATGRYNDGFWLNTTNLGPLCAFRLNSKDITNLFISTSGTISFSVPKGAETAESIPTSSGISFLAPLWEPIGIKPGAEGGSVWAASTTNHNILVTWQNVLIDRIDSSNTIGSIQCELCNNGDFIYRYSVDPGLTISNHVVGAQNNGFGESADLLNATNSALCVNAFEVRWAGYFQSYEMDEDGDSDNDGLLDRDEVRIYGTYPTLEDSDGDLWSDSYELTNSVFATDPLNPDSDGDTLIDSVDPDPLTWEDVTAINTNDGFTTQYHTDNGYGSSYDMSADSDNDGIPDWIEQLAGSSETNAASCCYDGEDYFDVTITLAADLPAPVILKIGPRTLFLRYAGTRTVKLAAGQAHAVTLLATERCLVSLGISFSTDKAVLLNSSAVFSGGAVLPAGTEQAGGTVVLPRINIDPGLICFHSSNSKAATGTPVPDINGTYSWYWFEEAGEGITLTGKTVNISWQGGGSSRSLNLAFRPDGATEDIYGHKTVYRCTLTEDNPGGDVADWIDPDSPPEPPCAWPQSPEETEDNPSTNNAAGPGEPFYAARYGIAIAVNNDDDDADGKLDNESTEDGVTGDDDLYASYLYTPFEGECCPCPAHNPAVSSVSIEYLSPKLRLWDNAEKTTVSTGVNAGQMQYLEGVSPSTSVTGESLILSWTEDDEYKAKTNNYTVFSLRMFGDYNLDGTINSNDYAAASDISGNGWVMPVASNTLRRLELKNDVLIPGNLILHLSGSSGIRIWDTPNPASTNTPLLVAGQTITNGVDGTSFGAYPDCMLYVEATDAGTATLCYSYQGTGDAEDFGCVTLLSMMAFDLTSVDLVAVPTSGLVVEKGDSVAMQASVAPLQYELPPDQPKWYYQQLLADGSWGNWTPFESSATGTIYEFTTITGGIFRVKAKLTDMGHTIERIYLRSDDDSHSSLKEGDSDAFGVVDKTIQKTLRDTAKDELGSTYYCVAGALPLIRDPRILFDGVPKCNVFVADMCDFSGANVDPPIGVNNVYYSGPHSANQWAAMPDSGDPGAPYPIPDWSVVPDTAPPQPGFVVASGREDGTSGHCGIVDYDGRWISAGPYDINRNAKFDDRSYWKNFISGLKTPPGKQVYAP